MRATKTYKDDKDIKSVAPFLEAFGVKLGDLVHVGLPDARCGTQLFVLLIGRVLLLVIDFFLFFFVDYNNM